MEFSSKRDYAEQSRFALINPEKYVRHVELALRDGKGPREGNYFEDLYTRARRYILEKRGRGGGTGISMSDI
jgi:hypothetical protein